MGTSVVTLCLPLHECTWVCGCTCMHGCACIWVCTPWGVIGKFSQSLFLGGLPDGVYSDPVSSLFPLLCQCSSVTISLILPCPVIPWGFSAEPIRAGTSRPSSPWGFSVSWGHWRPSSACPSSRWHSPVSSLQFPFVHFCSVATIGLLLENYFWKYPCCSHED